MSTNAPVRNAAWNLLGGLLPIPVVLVCIPALVAALGVERFGVLGLAWMVLGYFGMFDFGLAQSTTRFVAGAVARAEHGAVRSLVVGSAVLHCALGFAGAALLAALAPWLASSVFNLPPPLAEETRVALYWLSASVPAIVLTAALRGALEGLQRFDVTNLIRIPASVVNYAAPLLVLGFSTELPAVVAVIVVARYAVLIAYALACLKLAPPAAPDARLSGGQLIALAAYGGWLTASNFLAPLLMAADRFVIAVAISATAVAFYVTPYEIITKGWLLSASLMGAMFPVFAGLAATNPGAVRAACRTVLRYLVALAAPAIVVILGVADLLLGWWLGEAFRANSGGVARLLAAGMLASIVAQVPLTALNAVGNASVSAKIAACELPVYVAAVWFAAARFGIDGVAAVWALRAALDAAALFFAAHRVLPAEAHSTAKHRLTAAETAVLGGFLGAAAVVPFGFGDATAARLAALAVLLAALIAWEWRVLLRGDDRAMLRLWCNRLLSPAR